MPLPQYCHIKKDNPSPKFYVLFSLVRTMKFSTKETFEEFFGICLKCTSFILFKIRFGGII